jgi:hypothetical protein
VKRLAGNDPGNFDGSTLGAWIGKQYRTQRFGTERG